MSANRTLTEDRARALAARAFDDAMEATRSVNERVGEAMGVGEAVIRGLRNGTRTISAARILRMPDALRIEYLARLAATADMAATPSALRPTAEAAARLTARRASELTSTILEALDDGHISREEMEHLRGCVGRLHKAMNPLRAAGDA